MEQGAGEDVAGSRSQPPENQRREDDEGLPPLEGDDRVPQGEEHRGDGEAPAKPRTEEPEAIRREEIIESSLHVAAVEEFFGVAHAEQLVEDLEPQVVGETMSRAESGVRGTE